MSTNPIPQKEELEALYLSGKSMFEISQQMKCSINKIVYWMNKYEIVRTSWSDATYSKRNPNGDPFKIKTTPQASEVFLMGLGIGIYWGEGDKLSKNSVRVANTDSMLIKTFVTFLRTICSVEEQKFFYHIICFNDSNVQEVKDYWAKELKTNPAKFGKIVQIPQQGKGTYRKKSQYGVCTVSVSNPKLKKWIMGEVTKLKSLDGSVAERFLGKKEVPGPIPGQGSQTL